MQLGVIDEVCCCPRRSCWTGRHDERGPARTPRGFGLRRRSLRDVGILGPSSGLLGCAPERWNSAVLLATALVFLGAFEDLPRPTWSIGVQSVNERRPRGPGHEAKMFALIRNGPETNFAREPEVRAGAGRAAARRPPRDHRSMAFEQKALEWRAPGRVPGGLRWCATWSRTPMTWWSLR